MTLEEFGKQAKIKYPQYKNVPDADLAKRIIEKYPVYADRITEELATKNIKTQSKKEAPKQSAMQKAGNFLKEFYVTGPAKSVMSTIKGTAELGEKGLSAFWRTLLPKGAEKAMGMRQPEEQTGAEKIIPKNLVEGSTPTEKTSKVISDVAQFFIPGLGATKAPAAITGATKIEKGITFATKMIKEATQMAGLTAAQEGEVNKDTALAAASVPATGILGKVIGTPLKKMGDYIFKTTIPTTPLQSGKDIFKRLGIGEAVSQTGISFTKKSLANKIMKLKNTIESGIDPVIAKIEQTASGKALSMENIASSVKNDILANKNLYKKLGVTPIEIEKVNTIIDETLEAYKKLYGKSQLDASDIQKLKVDLGGGLEKELDKAVGATMKAKPFTEIQLRGKLQDILAKASPELDSINKKLAPLLEASKRLAKKGDYSGYLTDVLFGGLFAGRPQDLLSDPVGYFKDFILGVLTKRAVFSTASKTTTATLLKDIDKILESNSFRAGISGLVKEITSSNEKK